MSAGEYSSAGDIRPAPTISAGSVVPLVPGHRSIDPDLTLESKTEQCLYLIRIKGLTARKCDDRIGIKHPSQMLVNAFSCNGNYIFFEFSPVQFGRKKVWVDNPLSCNKSRVTGHSSRLEFP